jgi:hypothetical protein
MANQEDLTPAPKSTLKRSGRSPGYPGIDLGVALQRAREIWEAFRHHPTPVDSIYEVWGYNKGSGAGNITFAALRKFGLLVQEGSGAAREGRLTDLALDIIRDEQPQSAERDEAIQKAAMLPPIHREIWEHYEGELPTDARLQLFLERQRSFTPSGAHDFIGQFRKTLAFAGITEADIFPDTDEDTEAPAEVARTPRVLPRNERTHRAEPFVTGGVNTLIGPPPGTKSYRIPVDADEDVVVTFPAAVTAEKWETFITILNAMKHPILKARDTQPEPEEPTGYQD